MKNKILQLVAIFVVLPFPALVSALPMQQEVSFKANVSPIIHDYCLSCHEPGGKGYEISGLDMRTDRKSVV